MPLYGIAIPLPTEKVESLKLAPREHHMIRKSLTIVYEQPHFQRNHRCLFLWLLFPIYLLDLAHIFSSSNGHQIMDDSDANSLPRLDAENSAIEQFCNFTGKCYSL